jgi:DNA-binding transcriptional ArsR family regulator
VNETFGVLGEPNRYRIVELLLSGRRAVNDIGAKLHLNQPQVSKHLKLLNDAGFVQVEARATAGSTHCGRGRFVKFTTGWRAITTFGMPVLRLSTSWS